VDVPDDSNDPEPREGSTTRGEDAGAQDASDDGLPLAVRLVLVGIAVVVLTILLLAVVVAVGRRRRRARRRRGSPAALVVGAYQEALDDLSDSGVGGTRKLTAAELVALTNAHFGEEVAEHLRPISGLVNQALFAVPEATTDEQAATAWRSVDQLGSDLQRRRSRSQRLRRRMDPRVIAGRR
jgi:hypothetical protein